MKQTCLIVCSSCPDLATAESIATALVQAKLGACVHINGPISSVYMWQGEMCKDQEYQLQIKCLQQNFLQIEALVTQLHPYDVPELIATPITHGSAAYLEWIKETTLS
ncbi:MULTISPECIES: divalent-cation tolerance protein CutA [Shewanella]|uniref:divalent-cation tolerance protein CutA n=1 Tax=Shewanella TaxID=22 RepID=UPI000491EA75|nr:MULTISPECIES: divalent-cation tolerance protein CutA [Shewanella]QLE84158.1 divalent-cation tolerance protein CutA [Shewanella sp. Scap07]